MSNWIDTAEERIEALLELEPDWDKQGSPPISPHAARAASAFLRRLAPVVKPPRISPTPNEGLELGWGTGPNAGFSLVFQENGDVLLVAQEGALQLNLREVMGLYPLGMPCELCGVPGEHGPDVCNNAGRLWHHFWRCGKEDCMCKEGRPKSLSSEEAAQQACRELKALGVYFKRRSKSEQRLP